MVPALGVAVLITGGFLVFNALNPATKSEQAVVNVRSDQPNLLDVPRHPVTPGMAAAAAAKSGKTLDTIVLPDETGKEHSLKDMYTARPTVVIGVKDGCPCNLEAQPFLNQISGHFGEKVSFVGIMDADAKVARLFKNSLKVEYPILVSKDMTPFRTLGTEQSVYTTLINTDGKVVKQWPGYNQEMLNQLNAELARLTESKPAVLDLKGAPTEMTSGCYFFQPVGYEPENKS